jgi:hypothetical protein
MWLRHGWLFISGERALRNFLWGQLLDGMLERIHSIEVPLSRSAAPLLFLASALKFATGCGFSPFVASPSPGAAITGVIHGGQQNTIAVAMQTTRP